MAGHPLSKGNCYFEVRLIYSGAVSQYLALLLKLSSDRVARPLPRLICPTAIFNCVSTFFSSFMVECLSFAQSFILKCLGGGDLLCDMISLPHTVVPVCAQDCFTIKPAIVSAGIPSLTIFSTSYYILSAPLQSTFTSAKPRPQECPSCIGMRDRVWVSNL